MAYMQDCKVTFNGHDLTLNGLVNITVDKSLKPNIFATSKQLNTAKAMYGRRNIVTGFQRDVLQFDLMFSRLGNSFTEAICKELYKIFDVITYKPLTFGEQEIYFNAFPMVGSVSEMYLFAQSKGYFTMSFICDAGHGWLDREYSFERIVGENSAIPWEINNPSNVKNHEGYCRVFPYIEIDLPEFRPGSSEKKYHIGFGLSIEEQTKWFRLGGISQNQKLIIDNENKQMYSSAGDNLLEAMGDNIRFFYLEEGDNTVYHETYVGDETISSSYNITFYLSCPYMY